jgi:hypothetical protein
VDVVVDGVENAVENAVAVAGDDAKSSTSLYLDFV